MSATLQAPAPSSRRSSIPKSALLLALGITSFAALLLELALTRLFSVVLFYHFAFLAISIALLGLGAGGVFAYLLRPRLSRIPTRHLAVRLCLANAVAIVIVLKWFCTCPSRSTSPAKISCASRSYMCFAPPIFFNRIALLRRLRPRNLRASPPLRCRSMRRRARLPRRRPSAQLAGRPQHHSGRRSHDGHCRRSLGSNPRRPARIAAAYVALLIVSIAANHSGKLIRRGLRQRNISQSRLGRVRPLECPIPRRSRPPGTRAKPS